MQSVCDTGRLPENFTYYRSPMRGYEKKGKGHKSQRRGSPFKSQHLEPSYATIFKSLDQKDKSHKSHKTHKQKERDVAQVRYS